MAADVTSNPFGVMTPSNQQLFLQNYGFLNPGSQKFQQFLQQTGALVPGTPQSQQFQNFLQQTGGAAPQQQTSGQALSGSPGSLGNQALSQVSFGRLLPEQFARNQFVTKQQPGLEAMQAIDTSILQQQQKKTQEGVGIIEQQKQVRAQEALAKQQLQQQQDIATSQLQQQQKLAEKSAFDVLNPGTWFK